MAAVGKIDVGTTFTGCAEGFCKEWPSSMGRSFALPRTFHWIAEPPTETQVKKSKKKGNHWGRRIACVRIRRGTGNSQRCPEGNPPTIILTGPVTDPPVPAAQRAGDARICSSLLHR